MFSECRIRSSKGTTFFPVASHSSRPRPPLVLQVTLLSRSKSAGLGVHKPAVAPKAGAILALLFFSHRLHPRDDVATHLRFAPVKVVVIGILVHGEEHPRRETKGSLVPCTELHQCFLQACERNSTSQTSIVSNFGLP